MGFAIFAFCIVFILIVSGGVFQTMKSATGLSAPRTIAFWPSFRRWQLSSQ